MSLIQSLASDIPRRSSEKALFYFCCYRLILSCLFVFLYFFKQLPSPLGINDLVLFNQVASGYLVVAFILFFFMNDNRIPFNLQVAIHACLDIVFLTILMYASQGLNSGFGLLLLIAVVGASILSSRRIAIFIAALASLAVLFEEVYAKFTIIDWPTDYVHAGFLGLAYLMTSFFSQIVSTRALRNEQLVKQHVISLKNISELNEMIVQRLQSGILVVDSDKKIRLCNHFVQDILNMRSSIGKPLEEVLPSIAVELDKWRSRQTKSPIILHLDTLGIGVQIDFYELFVADFSEVLIFIEDVALIKQQAQQIKLASLGRLAAGIAHEIRNPLAAISNASQLLFESDALISEDRKLNNIILDHANRVDRIVKSIIAISRRQPSIFQEIILEKWLGEFVKEFSYMHGLHRLDIKLVGLHKGIANADSMQLYQVLSNLCENALRYSHRQPKVTLKYSGGSGNRRPYIDVIDQGGGIKQEYVAQLFEPFFTTERLGSGLGLYIARELCEANKANISLYENTNRGCCFRITFPDF